MARVSGPHEPRRPGPTHLQGAHVTVFVVAKGEGEWLGIVRADDSLVRLPREEGSDLLVMVEVALVEGAREGLELVRNFHLLLPVRLSLASIRDAQDGRGREEHRAPHVSTEKASGRCGRPAQAQLPLFPLF